MAANLKANNCVILKIIKIWLKAALGKQAGAKIASHASKETAMFLTLRRTASKKNLQTRKALRGL